MLPSEIPKLPHRPTSERVSCCLETSPPSRLPPWDVSLSLTLFFPHFVFYILSTSFQRERAAFLGAWYPPSAFRSCFVEVAQHSNDLLMNLWGESDHPILFLHHLGTTLCKSFQLYACCLW